MLYTKYTYIEEALLSKDEEKEIWKANWQKINKKILPQAFRIRSRI